MLQNGAIYDENYCIDHLCIVEFVILLCHLVNAVHISSGAFSSWIWNFFDLHIDETSIGPHIVISSLC